MGPLTVRLFFFQLLRCYHFFRIPGYVWYSNCAYSKVGQCATWEDEWLMSKVCELVEADITSHQVCLSVKNLSLWHLMPASTCSSGGIWLITVQFLCVACLWGVISSVIRESLNFSCVVEIKRRRFKRWAMLPWLPWSWTPITAFWLLPCCVSWHPAVGTFGWIGGVFSYHIKAC